MDELSDTKIRNATPTDKEYAIADGQGLSVVVRPNGTKLWLYRYLLLCRGVAFRQSL
jgi:hypothetical protein